MFFPLIAIGFAAIIAQILILRELVTVFNGNELTYGISLMIWLFSTGLGSYITGKIIPKINNAGKLLMYIETAAAVLIPAEIFFARSSKVIFNIPSGILPDLNSIFLISILAMAPMCILFGSLFTLGSKALANIGNMYIAESIGAVLGGIIFSFILIYFLNPFQIAGISGVILTLSAMFLYKNFIRSSVQAKTSRLIIFSLAIAINLILVHPYGAKIDRYTSKAQFKGLDLISSVDSIYGRISIIKDKGTYSYFESGNLIFSTASEPENEEIAHLAFLESKDPKTILLIGGGPAVMPEIKKHKPLKLDYIEIDPKLSDLAIIDDGRHFIKKTKGKYDLIIINLGDPNTASLNRFYTIEFLKECKSKLSGTGVLAFHISGSPDFMRNELRALNASIFKTISSAFKYTIVIPGTNNYFFGTDASGILTDEDRTLTNRWIKENVQTRYFDVLLIPHIVQRDKLEYVKGAVKFNKNTPINSDLKPISYLYSILVWLSYFPGMLNIAAHKIMDIKLITLAFWLFAAAVLIKLSRASTFPIIVGIIGFSAMIMQLLMIYSFQAIYGNVYHMIGILIAVFMGGLAFGSYLTNVKDRDFQIKHATALMIAAVALFAFYLISTPKLDYRLSQYLIPLFSFIFASLTGSVFPLAVKKYSAHNLENKAGILYAADLFGGAAAALLTSLLFMPVYGILGSCVVAAILYLASFILIR